MGTALQHHRQFSQMPVHPTAHGMSQHQQLGQFAVRQLAQITNRLRYFLVHVQVFWFTTGLCPEPPTSAPATNSTARGGSRKALKQRHYCLTAGVGTAASAP